MSQGISTYQFTEGDLPSASVLQQMHDFVMNMVSTDATIEVVHGNGLVDFRLNAARLLVLTNLHPFKLWLRHDGTNYQYAICEQHPDTTGTPLAGRYYKPSGAQAAVTRVAWTDISATTSFWLKFYITAGSITVTIETTEPTLDMVSDPATFYLQIGTITFTSSVPLILQCLQSDVMLGMLLAPWYAGYDDADIDQILIHAKSAAPSWFVTSTDTKERLLKLSTTNTLGTIAASTGTTEYLVTTKNSTFGTAEGDGPCS